MTKLKYTNILNIFTSSLLSFRIVVFFTIKIRIIRLILSQSFKFEDFFLNILQIYVTIFLQLKTSF